MTKRLLSWILAGVLIVAIGGCKITVDEQLSRKDAVLDVVREFKDGRVYFPKSIAGGGAIDHIMALQEDKDYHIIVDSFGGSAYDAIAIINRLQELQRDGFHITTESYGYAMSGGAFVFAAGDTRIAHTGGVFMIHGAGFKGYGGVRHSLRVYERTGVWDREPYHLDILTILDTTFKSLFTNIGWSDREIKDWFYTDDNNFMSAEEALEMNLATILK
jgi:ATP-dependent protease ClpP protease subunit